MVARDRDMSLPEPERRAVDSIRHAHVAGDNLARPGIEPVDVADSGADLPAEGDEDRGRDQGASDHSGDGNAHSWQAFCKIGDLSEIASSRFSRLTRYAHDEGLLSSDSQIGTQG